MTAADIRALLDNVHDTLTMAEHPPTGTPGTGAASASRPPLPVAVLDAKVNLKNTLTSWALLTSEEGQFVIQADDEALSIAGWIYTKADWLAQHPAVDEFMQEVTDDTRALRNLYRTRDERLFCGIHAGQKIYARPGQETIVLPDGRVERVKTLRDEMKAQMLDVIETAPNVAAIARTYFGMQITTKQIHTTYSDDKRRRRVDGLDIAGMDGKTKLFRVRDVQRRLTRVALDKAS